MCSNKLVKESSKVFKQAGQGVEQGVQASWSRSRARCSSKLVKESSKVFKQAGQGVEQGVQTSRKRTRACGSSSLDFGARVCVLVVGFGDAHGVLAMCVW